MSQAPPHDTGTASAQLGPASGDPPIPTKAHKPPTASLARALMLSDASESDSVKGTAMHFYDSDDELESGSPMSDTMLRAPASPKHGAMEPSRRSKLTEAIAASPPETVPNVSSDSLPSEPGGISDELRFWQHDLITSHLLPSSEGIFASERSSGDDEHWAAGPGWAQPDAPHLAALVHEIEALQDAYRIVQEELDDTSVVDEATGLPTVVAALTILLPARRPEGAGGGSGPTASSDARRHYKVPWEVRLSIPYSYPVSRPSLISVHYHGDALPHATLKGLDDAVQATPATLSLHDTLDLVTVRLQDVPYPPVSNVVAGVPVLVRDFAYDTTDPRFWGKDKPPPGGFFADLAARSRADSDPTLTGLPVARALYSFVPELEGEMALNEGDELYILDHAGNGWTYAAMAEQPSRRGFVPEHYLTSIQS